MTHFSVIQERARKNPEPAPRVPPPTPPPGFPPPFWLCPPPPHQRLVVLDEIGAGRGHQHLRERKHPVEVPRPRHPDLSEKAPPPLRDAFREAEPRQHVLDFEVPGNLRHRLNNPLPG